MSSEYTVFLGLHVGKGEHHACALDPAGKRLHDKPLPNDEALLRALFERVAEHGPMLLGRVRLRGTAPVSASCASALSQAFFQFLVNVSASICV
ncbi:transposase [Actinomadura geliboluensis]|uniref:IS110 family transposase n=1 Tax=Actinomadura geliboluensis TaxID=882440 RepID=UPI003719D750